jgi:hypothetical protein
MKKVSILMFFLVLVLVPIYYFYFYSSESQNTADVADQTPTTSQEGTIDINFGWPKDWQKHESKLFNYSFAFPSGWYFLGYDEENPAIVAGGHTLSNYDPVKVEQFMDHGIIDWQKFRGEKVAIKVDLSVRKLEGSKADFIDGYYKDFTLQPMSDLNFGEEKTFQYNSHDSQSSQLVRSFIAFPNSGRVATANVFVSNQPNQLILEDSEEWKELESIFKTFRF